MGTGERDEKLLDHAWRHFDLHAKQRLTLFNFYIVLCGLIAAAWANAMTSAPPLTDVAAFMAGLMTLASVIFWKIDQRNSFLVKRAEHVMARAEERLFPGNDGLFFGESDAWVANRSRWNPLKQWSHGHSLRVMFAVMGMIGVLGVLNSLWLFPMPAEQPKIVRVEMMPPSEAPTLTIPPPSATPQ